MDKWINTTLKQFNPIVYNNVGYFSSLKTPRSGTHRDHGVGRWEMGVAHPTSLCRVQYITTVHTGRVCVCVRVYPSFVPSNFDIFILPPIPSAVLPR